MLATNLLNNGPTDFIPSTEAREILRYAENQFKKKRAKASTFEDKEYEEP